MLGEKGLRKLSAFITADALLAAIFWFGHSYGYSHRYSFGADGMSRNVVILETGLNLLMKASGLGFL